MARHPGNIERRGDSFRVRLTVGGKRHYFTMSETSKKDVEQFAREKDAELRRWNGKGLPGTIPFSELVARYRETRLVQRAPNTQAAYRQSIAAFETYFVRMNGDPPSRDIRPSHIQGFIEWRRVHSAKGDPRARPLSARSLAKDRAVLHTIFGYATALEVCQGNPVTVVKPPKGDARQPIILTDPQYERLLHACEGRPMLAPFVLVLGETGIRCESEALWLRWQDIDLDRGFITVESVRKGRRTKSGKARLVPMTSRLREALGAHMAEFRMRTYGEKKERTEWVFHHPISRRTARSGERIKSLRGAFAGAVGRAKLPSDLNQHDLRHRRVTTWLAAGKSPVLVQKAMGHSDLQTTMRYTHLVAEDLLALVEGPVDREAVAHG